MGNFGLSEQQERAQIAIWAAWSAPFYMSNDLRALSKQSADLLKNEHLIRVNQDPLGVWALMVGELLDGQLQAFVKPIEPIRNGCPSFVVVYLNRATLGNRVKVRFRGNHHLQVFISIPFYLDSRALVPNLTRKSESLVCFRSICFMGMKPMNIQRDS